MNIHILFSRATPRPFFRADARLGLGAEETVITDCCTRRVPACDAVARLVCQEMPLGGYGGYQSRDFDGKEESFLGALSYCDEPRWDIECAPDSGCKCDRRKLCGAAGRRAMIWG